MRRDSLLSLSRLRKLEVDEAKRDLARTVSAAMQAMVEAEKAEARIALERKVATDAPEQGAAFAAWVPHGRAEADRRARQHVQAEARSDEERERLAQARAAERAVEELAEARALERRLEAMRKIQAVADEIAADRARRGTPTGFGEKGQVPVAPPAEGSGKA